MMMSPIELLRRRLTAWILASRREGGAFPGRSDRIKNARIIVINPLGEALSHYSQALVCHLTDAGVESEVVSITEPSRSGKSRFKWLMDYFAVLVSVGKRTRKRHSREIVLVTWPVLGFLDLVIVKILCGSTGMIVYHDPRPLVRSAGSSRAVAGLVRLVGKRPRALVHSKEAAQAMCNLGFSFGLTMVPHPILPTGAVNEPTRDYGIGARHCVRVLGQYKEDRDVDLLRVLAEQLGKKYHFEIVGRGWPPVTGWKVDARFVSEDELDELIATSGAIIIPYKRFYQSGIAIRALEKAVPIVGRAQTNLRDLYGPRSRLLVEEDGKTRGVTVEAWVSAIEFALEHGRAESVLAAKLFHEDAARGWASLVR
ncbi:hypothetical protein QMY03_21000 [Arthrobacter sp. KFRI-F3372]|uniref:hypothetical protein n=1 Tax=Pseudarthrobacter oxydans TaxID=1671 RepID=UPI0027A36F56|nr:hypothetical protein QMY03_21000 [Arthrobacter sp. KFRI-F3372]